MKIVFLILGLIAFNGQAIAQFGALQIEFDWGWVDAEGGGKIVLKQNDKEIRTTVTSEDEDVYRYDSLLPGRYTVVVYNNNHNGVSEFTEQVKQDSVNMLYLPTYYSDYYCLTCLNDTSDFDVNGVFNVLYGQPLDQDVFINNRFEAQLGNEFWNRYKHIGFGYSAGGYYAVTRFQNDTSFKQEFSEQKERYSNFGIFIGGSIRFPFFDNSILYKKGMYVDLGAMYKLPLSFRHTAVNGAEKHVTRSIHRYNDVHVTAKVGYLPVGLLIDYRLFDFTKNNFPNDPKINVGVTVNLRY